MQEHQLGPCPCRVTKCMVKGCDFQGDGPQLEAHMIDAVLAHVALKDEYIAKLESRLTKVEDTADALQGFPISVPIGYAGTVFPRSIPAGARGIERIGIGQRVAFASEEFEVQGEKFRLLVLDHSGSELGVYIEYRGGQGNAVDLKYKLCLIGISINEERDILSEEGQARITAEEPFGWDDFASRKRVLTRRFLRGSGGGGGQRSSRDRDAPGLRGALRIT
ncbi:hypothetical protein DFJ74DRAFT_321561 [Hyaloraphidium curvatum]|nr:hypothetical protein DFJ74DRAFT_321561 [Hyaloraphidium curvatum]